jgi:orotidine-5'-phosphate decarboxylase
VEAKEKIIVALDVDSLAKVGSIVPVLAPFVGYFKVGLELLTHAGAPQVVQHIKKFGGKVFFDAKFSDIPNTVEGASRAMSEMGVSLFTIHASCGPEALASAAKVKGQAKALAVTVLTSIDAPSCENIFGAGPEQKVAQFARDAVLSGMDGIVCSGQELDWLKSDSTFNPLLKVVPGIRPTWASAQDQKRVMTPAEAIRAGATHLVIGRPIMQPPLGIGTPLDAIQAILKEVASA